MPVVCTLVFSVVFSVICSSFHRPFLPELKLFDLMKFARGVMHLFLLFHFFFITEMVSKMLWRMN